MFAESKTGETLTVSNPVDDIVVTKDVQVAGIADVDAVDATTRAASQGSWSKIFGAKRAKCIMNFADLIEANIERLAHLETAAMGQSSIVGRGSIGLCPPDWRCYAVFADKVRENMFPEDRDGLHKLIRCEQIGFCAGISAWNGTQVSVYWKLAQALAAGNTCIFETSEKSPLGALSLGVMVIDAGFPPGAVNLVSSGCDTGHFLFSHMGIDKISVIGYAMIELQFFLSQSI